MRRGWKRLAVRARGWRAGRVVDAVVPVSAAIARRDTERVFLPARKVRVVYNGIRVDLFPNPERTPREVVRVVYAGQLIPQKGVMTLLRAHERLRAGGVTNYELLVAGAGHQEAALKTFCATAGLGDVRFLGHTDSVPGLFGAADVVVVPSEWFEAFGLVAAEAMACGAACLVSDAGALPEVVGAAGRVFKAGDAADLADRLRELIRDPEGRRRLGAAGRERVESLFTLDRMVEGHVAVCEDVLRGSL
ncbi:GT4 family glycosyltransferase [Frigoriglobus tundricola]|uniref:GT4 family glycosyltransferase n=1 Tax=Frigoriglobus tundricola TaxID=2774151 RepID=A0A6M5YX86_9BACT|nr:GT4 family glycosyltransferase [Frigoriglobus tundricola]